ncbi:MAG: hypothetical protein QXO98_01100 [Sulfolobales archaeon]
MRRHNLIIYALLFVIIVQLISSVNTHAEGEKFEVLSVIWGTPSAPTEVNPGDLGQLTVVLRTKNSIQASTLVAFLELPKGFSSINGESNVMTYLRYSGTSIPAGTILELQFKVKVKDDASLGRYTAKLILEYVVEVLYYSRTYSEEIYLTIPINGRPDINLYNLNTSIQPGQQTLLLKLVNNGNVSANKVAMDISIQPLIYSNVSRVELEKLLPQDETLIPIEVFIPPSLSNSTLTMTYSLSYYGPLSVPYSKAFKNTIYVEHYEKPLLNIYADLNEALSGRVLVTNLIIVNNGGFAKDLIIRLSAQQPLQVRSESSYSIGSLEPHRNLSIPVEVYSLPTSSDVISSLVVTVEYDDSYGVSYSKTFNLPIILRAFREPLVSTDLVTKEVYGGVESKLVLNLSNLGSAYLKNISVQAVLPQNIILLTSPKYGLGILPPKSYEMIEFLIKAQPTDSITYSKVSFQIKCVDELGNYFTDSSDFTISVKPREIRPSLTLDIEPNKFNPLSSGSLMIKVASIDEISNVVVSISSEGTPLILSGSKELLISRLYPKEEHIIKIPYVVANKPGSYSLNIVVKYLDPNGILRSSTYIYPVEVLPLKTALSINLSPSNIMSSSTTTLTFNVTNYGELRIRELTLSINPQGSVVTLVNTSRFYIDGLEPGESKLFNVAVRSGYVSTYTTVVMSLLVTYYDTLNQLYSETYTSALIVEPLTPSSKLEVTINTTELMIASINDVVIRLKNIGNDVIEGVNYRISSGSALNIIGVNDGYIPYLKPGESVSLYVPVYVTLTSTYTSNIVLSLTYTDKALGSVRSEDKVFTLLLRGRVDLRVVDYVVMPATVSVGQTFSVSLTLINVGVTPAYSTFVNPVLTGLPVRSVTEERMIYLGNIDVGSTTAATITLQLTNTSERVIKLPIIISYLDNLRSPRNVTTEVIIRVSPFTNSTQITPTGVIDRGSNTLLTYVVVGLIAIAAVVIAIRKFMRR